MKNLLIHETLQAFYSFLLGVVTAYFMLLTIIIFSVPLKQEDIKPALIVDLSTWKSSHQEVKSTALHPKKNNPSPEKIKNKRPNKRQVIKKPTTNKKPISKPASEPELMTTEETISTPGSIYNAEDNSLPQPMPMFRLTETPRFLHKATPVYPENMKVIGKTGVVKLSALIDKTGKVRKVTIIKSAGDAFDLAAVNAIKRSTFIPAKIHGRPVAVLLKVPVRFMLM